MAKTVLIVDDIEFVRKTLTEIFTAARYQVVGEACDGAQAVELYQRLRPNVVTMDVVMPRMSGIEATKKIISLDKDAKVVIVSAMGQENLVMDAITVGAKDYVLKPFTAADILKTVDRVLMDDNSHGKSHVRDQKAV